MTWTIFLWYCATVYTVEAIVLHVLWKRGWLRKAWAWPEKAPDKLPEAKVVKR